MTDERSLSYYQIEEYATIHMIKRLGFTPTRSEKSNMRSTSLMQAASAEPLLQEPYWPSGAVRTEPVKPSSKGIRAPKLQFDDDECLLSPATYYKKLDDRELTVVENSEFYRANGRYENDSIKSADGMYASSHCSLEVWRSFHRQFTSKSLNDDPTASPETALSLGKSYMILCNILDMIEDLKIDIFTIMFYRRVGIGEMVEVTNELVIDLHDAIGDPILDILSRNGQPKSKRVTTEALMRVLVPALQACLESLGIPDAELLLGCNLVHLCRILVWILDLGLVTFMGSHSTRFDQDYLSEDHAEIVADLGNKVGFLCFLRRLACLNKFVNGREVWTFRPLVRFRSINFLLLRSYAFYSDLYGLCD